MKKYFSELCGKVAYERKRDAVTMMHIFQERKRKRHPVRVYPCPDCNKWHMTSKQ